MPVPSPADIYLPPDSSGSVPNLARRRIRDATIDDRLRVFADWQGNWSCLDAGAVITVNISSALVPEIPHLAQQGRKIIVHVGEPPADFDRLLPYIDHANVEIVMTGALNYDLKRARLHRIETFFGELCQLYKHFADELPPVRTHARPLYFDALLGTASRLPRTLIRDHLANRHPGKNLVRTYSPRNPYLFRHAIEGDYVWPEGVDWQGQEDQPFYAAAMVRYRGFPAMVCLIMPWNVYEQTAYSIVAETYVRNEWNFYTEKTAKPMLARRLFVAFAGQYHLRNLRSLGFQTFDGIIDERYDLESDPDRRWRMALEQVDQLCAQDQSSVLTAVRPIAEHNFQVLQGTDWIEQANDLLIDLALESC